MSEREESGGSAPEATESARDLDGRHRVLEASYKGWLIRYRNEGQWTAQLFEPGCGEPSGDGVVASHDEGEAVLLQRAQRKIDSATDS
jgi:hypothetical protein